MFNHNLCYFDLFVFPFLLVLELYFRFFSYFFVTSFFLVLLLLFSLFVAYFFLFELVVFFGHLGSFFYMQVWFQISEPQKSSCGAGGLRPFFAC